MRHMFTSIFAAACALIAQVVSAQTTAVEYYHTDAIGSVRIVTDAAGNLMRQHDYWPFGAEVNPPPGECTDVRDPRGFTGQERDKETCQDYFGGRYLRSTLGRFTTVDPVLDVDMAIADPQRWNRYTYVANNPLSLVDPDGREIVAVNPKTGKFYGGGAEVLNAQRTHDRLLTPLHDIALAGLPLPPVGVGGLISRLALPSSRALGRALESAGVLRPADAAAHHIVAGAAKGAAAARATLAKFGIGINDAANGVFLPVGRHQSIHTAAYFEGINSALSRATSKEEALKVLKALAEAIAAGKQPG